MTGYEFEKFVEKVQPDLVGSGIKEKYIFQKMGVPFRQMHSWDYSGPYHGYDGFPIFARDMDMAINAPIWRLTEAPGSSNRLQRHPNQLLDLTFRSKGVVNEPKFRTRP